MTREPFIVHSELTNEIYVVVGKEKYPVTEQAIKAVMATKALEKEPILDRDCEHCSRTYGTFGCCTTVSNEWVYSCKVGQKEYLLNKIRAEIEKQEKWLLQAGYNAYNVDIAFNSVKSVLAENEVEDT